MNDVAIIGGGITGLSAAFWLRAAGVPFTLYESGSHCGGVIQTVTRDGFTAETGPSTVLETSPIITRMVEDLGLASERIYTAPSAQSRYVVKDGKLVPLPGSGPQFFTTPLFSASAKARLMVEPFLPRGHGEESVADFVRRRIGKEFLDYAINPFVAGIYAGDPERLSVRYGFPKLEETEQRYGSLIVGQVLGARERRKRGTVSKQDAPKFSFRKGLQTLMEGMERAFGGMVRVSNSLTSLKAAESGFELLVSSADGISRRRHSSVLLTAPAYRLAEIETELPHAFDLQFLRAIKYSPVATISFGFNRADVGHSLEGFGFLVPAVEKRKILGAVFSSSLFPNRAPSGKVLMSCFIGGARSPELVNMPGRELAQLALADLGDLLGIKGAPVFQSINVYPRAIPQYELGYGEFLGSMARVEHGVPGLFFAGNYRDGISVSDSILSGEKAAGKIRAFLQQPEITNQLAAVA